MTLVHPANLVNDRKFQVSNVFAFMKLVMKYNIKFHISEPINPEQNPANDGIRVIERRQYKIMTKNAFPKRLWDYELVWVCKTRNLIVPSSRYANVRTGLKIILVT